MVLFGLRREPPCPIHKETAPSCGFIQKCTVVIASKSLRWGKVKGHSQSRHGGQLQARVTMGAIIMLVSNHLFMHSVGQGLQSGASHRRTAVRLQAIVHHRSLKGTHTHHRVLLISSPLSYNHTAMETLVYHMPKSLAGQLTQFNKPRFPRIVQF